MKEKKIGTYTAYVLEDNDVIVVMGEVESHSEVLVGAGLERQESGEYLGRGQHLYALGQKIFFALFSGRDTGGAGLSAQATDGNQFYQIDALPVVTGEEDEGHIEEIYALDLETRTFITEGISKFRVG